MTCHSRSPVHCTPGTVRPLPQHPLLRSFFHHGQLHKLIPPSPSRQHHFAFPSSSAPPIIAALRSNSRYLKIFLQSVVRLRLLRTLRMDLPLFKFVYSTLDVVRRLAHTTRSDLRKTFRQLCLTLGNSCEYLLGPGHHALTCLAFEQLINVRGLGVLQRRCKQHSR